MPHPSACKRRPAQTLHGGSLHTPTAEAGHTTSTRARAPACTSESSSAITCRVLPRPGSSSSKQPRTPGTPGSSWPATPAARNCTPSRWYGRSFSASAAGTCAVRPSASASSSAAASPSRRRRCVDASAAPWGLLLARSADCSLAAAAAPSSGGTRASPVRDGEVHGSPASPTSTSDVRSTAMCASMASEKAPSEPIENTVCA